MNRNNFLGQFKSQRKSFDFMLQLRIWMFGRSGVQDNTYKLEGRHNHSLATPCENRIKPHAKKKVTYVVLHLSAEPRQS